MKKLLLLLSVFVLTVSAYAQKTGVISGRITDPDGNFSLPGATVKLSEGNRYAVSNQTGDYEFLNIPAGTYQVEVSYIGYQAVTQPVVVEAGKNTVLNFSMGSGAETIDEVVVVGDALKGQARALNQQKN
ncbi:MAG: carboxypeptidase-like regulatory domain-containing protein, partial [Sphingobacteriaceae bacterium]